MRDPDAFEGGQNLKPPPRLYERLAQIPGYTWDHDTEPFHSVSPYAQPRVSDTMINVERHTIIGMSSA